MKIKAIETEFTSKDNILSEWNGKSDTSWYNKTSKKFHLNKAEQLAGLAELVNVGEDDFKHKTIYLDSDLDLNWHNWLPIGGKVVDEAWYKSSYKRCFSGTLDGKHHFIKNLNTDSSDYCHGLFGYVVNGTIKRIKVINAHIYNKPNEFNNNIGIIADEILNSYILGSYTPGKIAITSDSVEYSGGIVGLCKNISQVVGCYSTATINIGTSNSTCIGGIVGGWDYQKCFSCCNSIISNCWFDGDINCTGSPFAGGIIGRGNSPGVQIRNCFVPNKNIICDEFDNVAIIGTIEEDSNVFTCYYPSNNTSEENNIECKAINKVYKTLFGLCTFKDRSFDQNGHIIASKFHCDDTTVPYVTAIEDFNDKEFINKLNENTEPGVAWVQGINHPTFYYDDPNNISELDTEIKNAKDANDDNFDCCYPIKKRRKRLSVRQRRTQWWAGKRFPYITPWYVEY